MTQKSVEALLGRLVTDARLRRRFAEEPVAVIADFRAQGQELSAVESDALAATDTHALQSFAEALDQRIRKLDPGHDPDKKEE